ncbi:MAG: 3-hydroxyacyl-CoA dehydrogenase NAD-binding domain-containing protein [Planctomycetaceae bacterium]
MNVETLVVVGAGTMGRGIIETAAVHGLTVKAVEPSDRQRESALGAIEQSLAKAIKRGKLEIKSPNEALSRVTWHADLADVAAVADFVIEAVSESPSLKEQIFRQLDVQTRPHVVLASNTSSISITRIAAFTGRPESVVGMHFFNPVPIMQPVEIVRGVKTSQSTIDQTRQLAERLGKQAFVVADSPGFVVNRVWLPMINEAAFALQEGVADAATIDSLMKLGCNHPMGPLELADLVGLDVCLAIAQVLHRELGDPKFRPCPLLVRKVDAGQLGCKTGEGFYKYT